jgi:hypothetical protein
LARIELRVALQEFHRRIPRFRLDGHEPIVHGGGVFGIDQLRLAW